MDNDRAMFESRISAGGTEKLPYSEIFRISSWSYDMEGHAKEMCGAILWVSKQGRLNNSTKYLLPASMTTTLKKKKWNLLEKCHEYALKLF